MQITIVEGVYKRTSLSWGPHFVDASGCWDCIREKATGDRDDFTIIKAPLCSALASEFMFFQHSHSFGPLPVMSTYNPIDRLYNAI